MPDDRAEVHDTRHRIFAVAAFILSYQIKSNRWLFLLQLIGSAHFCLQFFLLDAFSGCLSLAVNILRNAMMMKYNDWKWVRWKGCPVIIAVRLPSF